MHQASYCGFPSESSVTQGSICNAIPSNHFSGLPSADSGQLWPMYPELAQPMMPLMSNSMNLNGSNQPENYEGEADIISAGFGLEL